MIDTHQFEGLLEALSSEIEELPHGSVRENLMDIHSALYSILEDISLEDVEKSKEENTIMKELLADHLSYEDKLYYRIKYNLDLGA